MGARKIVGSIVDFKTDISQEDETIFNYIIYSMVKKQAEQKSLVCLKNSSRNSLVAV